MKIKNCLLIIVLFFSAISGKSQTIEILKSTLVGEGIVEFVPKGFDKNKTPSLILKEEPTPQGIVPTAWSLIPKFYLENDKAGATLKLTGEVNLYGTGEVTGPLVRNGQSIKLWNTDTGAYSVDDGKRLYQSHPWVMGVRNDGSSFGILFDSSWKAELHTNSDEIKFNSEGALFRIYIIDRDSPQEVLKGLAELIGTIELPALWTLGYHQCRFSYKTEERVKEIADSFRLKKIPCDVIWMDIDYMDEYKVFTFDKNTFPNPKKLNNYLHDNGFRAIYMIDPGVKVDNSFDVYKSGTENDVWIKNHDGEQYHGKVWPGDCVFPDFTMPDARKWWAGLYKDFFKNDMDGIWNDVNEPTVFDGNLPENERLGTIPYDIPHRGGGDLPPGPHLLYHNAYGRLMVEASYNGIKAANPEKRPFLLTRANILGGQRYAATWTGDNYASWEHLKLSVPMSLTLGLSGQPFNGPDIGGFLGNTSGELWASWLGFATFMPFARGHACAGTNNKEPWAYGEAIEESSRIALERRYRLLPYLYTTFYNTSKTGIPVMQPVFFANPKDLDLRTEEQAFLLGEHILVVPSFAENPQLPSGIWEEFSLVNGDLLDQYQAQLKIKGGSIVPIGKVIQNTNENSFDPLTLLVCLNKEGTATGELYVDNGDGWGYKKGDYSVMMFMAQRKGDEVNITLHNKEGGRKVEMLLDSVQVIVYFKGNEYKSLGNLRKGLKIFLDK